MTRIVLVHGFGACAHFWRHWVPALAERHEVWNVEWMGIDDPQPHGDGPRAGAEALVEAMLAEEDRPTVLVGHSLGGAVVLIAALLLADRGAVPPEGVVVVSGAVYPQKLPPFISMARIPGLGLLFLLIPPPRALLRLGLRGIVHDPASVTEALVEGYLAPLRSRSRRKALLRAARRLDPADPEGWSGRYGEIASPTLLIWGEEDRVVRPRVGVGLAAVLPDARHITLPGVGHLPPEEAPERSLEAVLEFIRSRCGDASP